jgi:hypothetical protein
MNLLIEENEDLGQVDHTVNYPRIKSNIKLYEQDK